MIPQKAPNCQQIAYDFIIYTRLSFYLSFDFVCCFFVIFHNIFWRFKKCNYYLLLLGKSQKTEITAKTYVFRRFFASQRTLLKSTAVNYIYYATSSNRKRPSVKNTKIVIFAQIVNVFFYISDIGFFEEFFVVF